MIFEKSLTVVSACERHIVLPYMAFVFFSNFSTILYFLAVYLEYVGFGLGQISLLLMTYQASKFILEIPTGYIADRFGRKASGVIGLVLLAAYYVALLVLPLLPVLVIAFFIKGLALSLISGSFESLYIDAVEPSSLVRYNTIERLIFYGSYALAAMLGGLLAGRSAFGVSLGVDIIAVLCALACGLAFKNGPSGRSTQMKGEPSAQGSALSALHRILSDHVVLALYLMDAAQAFAYVGLEDFFTLVLQRAGMSSALAGLCIAVQLVVSAVFGLLVPRILEHASGRHLLVVCAVSRLVVTALILLPGAGPLAMAALYTLQLVLYALFAPVKYALFQRRLLPEFRCTAISVQSQMVSIGGSLFYLASGVLSARMEVEPVLLGALAVAAAIYVPALLYSSRYVAKAA